MSDNDLMMCQACRGKGTYAGLDITCRSCNGSGVERPPKIDFTFHQIAEIRGAVLSVIDEGHLVNGKREPWRFYPDSGSKALQQCLTAMRKARDEWSGYAPDVDWCNAWDAARAALASDWHMDESGESNQQRLEFADDVQNYLVKKITGAKP